MKNKLEQLNEELKLLRRRSVQPETIQEYKEYRLTVFIQDAILSAITANA